MSADDDLMHEIREANLTYMMLSRHMIREDKVGAIFRLGISQELADLIEDLTPGQILKLAECNTLLCRFRFDDHQILNLLTDQDKMHGMAPSHAAILMAGQAVEDIN